MRFPDEVKIVHPTGTDAYGNSLAASFDSSSSSSSPGFLVSDSLLLLPATAKASSGDRFVVNGRTFTGYVAPARSPSRTVMLLVTIKEV